jgi:regulator of replication initiation timing
MEKPMISGDATVIKPLKGSLIFPLVVILVVFGAAALTVGVIYNMTRERSFLRTIPAETSEPTKDTLLSDRFLTDSLDQIARLELELREERSRSAELSRRPIPVALPTPELPPMEDLDLQENYEAQLTALRTQVNSLELGNTQLTQENAQLAPLRTRIASLEQENTRLAQENTQLAPLRSRIASLEQENNQFTQGNTQLAAFKTQINSLEQENAQLTQQNTQLDRQNAELTQQNLQLRQSGQPVTVTGPSAEDERNRSLAVAYQSITSAYTNYGQRSENFPELERFLNTNSVQNAFPGFADQIRRINTDAANSGYRGGLTNVMEILDVALRIENKNTRRRYLQGLADRHQNNDNIKEFLDILIKRL